MALCVGIVLFVNLKIKLMYSGLIFNVICICHDVYWEVTEIWNDKSLIYFSIFSAIQITV